MNSNNDTDNKTKPPVLSAEEMLFATAIMESQAQPNKEVRLIIVDMKLDKSLPDAAKHPDENPLAYALYVLAQPKHNLKGVYNFSFDEKVLQKAREKVNEIPKIYLGNIDAKDTQVVSLLNNWIYRLRSHKMDVFNIGMHTKCNSTKEFLAKLDAALPTKNRNDYTYEDRKFYWGEIRGHLGKKGEYTPKEQEAILSKLAKHPLFSGKGSGFMKGKGSEMNPIQLEIMHACEQAKAAGKAEKTNKDGPRKY